MFLVIIIRLVPVVKELANVRFAIANQLGSVSRVLDRLASLETAREIDAGGRSNLMLEKNVRIKDVAFRYNDSDDWALRDVNLIIPAKNAWR